MSYYVVPLLFLITVVLGLDPLSAVLGADTTFTAVNLGLFLFRLLDVYQVLYEQLKAVNAYFIVGLMVVCSMNDFIRRLDQKKKISSHKLKPEAVQLYKELQIWAGYTNLNFWHIAIPPLISE